MSPPVIIPSVFLLDQQFLSATMSIASQPQFRYTQPPSKVLHLRNLPWECSEEELIELGRPFGKVVNTKCNVGANRNQAFIEFADINQAISMISYYASSAEPAQVRGKTVYLQYSNRQEIVNDKTTGETTSNVLLVTIEGVLASDVSIDVLHLVDLIPALNCPVPLDVCSSILFLLLNSFPNSLTHVFSAFGFVQKIATFEKAAGFQALIQFSGLDTATSAKNSLDGRSIPRYLLQENVGPCTLRIAYSAHTDLNVKFQSHRSRDYTNPYLPVAPSAIEGTGQDGKKLEPESNVLLASIENMQYAVSIDVLHTVFSAFGPVQKIAIFEKNAGFQALIQYPDIPTATVAKDALEGHCIYDGGFCKLSLAYSRHTDLNVKVNNDRGRDYTMQISSMLTGQPSILGQQPIPMITASVTQYSDLAFQTPNSMAMRHRGIASWDAGAGHGLPPQMHGQMYTVPGFVPPGMAHVLPGMNNSVTQLPSQGNHQFNMPSGRPYSF